jgi:outer membrane protein, multidrug efflux system
MHPKTPHLAAGLLFLVLQGCALAPAYLRPEMPVADTFFARQTGPEPPASQKQPVEDAAEIGWRDYFADPDLQNLIAAALAGNRDLRATALTVESFQAQYRIQRAALLPSLGGSGSAAKQRISSGGKLVTTESYSLSVGVTAYELDFFGRVKNLKDDALEQYLALEETYRSARISLVAEVAKAYLTLLADREILAITEDTLGNEEKSYSLVEQRTNEGISTQLALAQARIGLETAKVNLAIYRRLVAQDLHNLALLCGAARPEPVVTALSLGDRQPLPRLSDRLSSAVLLQRPDILAAEHQLKGAHANIGAARAAFFPSISLTANAGAISGDLGKLFDGGSGTWLFAPTITLPIFTGGRLAAQLDIATIRREIAIAGYEEAIQTAFREVADALIARDTYEEQLAAQKANLQANQDYYTMARDRYQEGLDSSLTLLDAQRSLYAARQGYVSLRLAQLVNEVDLYKVLGGGWKEGG